VACDPGDALVARVGEARIGDARAVQRLPHEAEGY
jgi:hypothetical protein